MALERVGGRIKANKYASYDEVLEQIDRVCDNAMRFNEEGSECHVAGAVVKRVTHAKVDVIRRRGVPVGTNAANTRPVVDDAVTVDTGATASPASAAGGGGKGKGGSEGRKGGVKDKRAGGTGDGGVAAGPASPDSSGTAEVYVAARL